MQTTFHTILFTIMLVLFAAQVHSFAQEEIELSSPNMDIVYKFKIVNGVAEYAVTYKKKLLINYSPLTLSFLNETEWGKKFKAGKSHFKEGVEKYSLIVGKTKEVNDFYKEVVIPMHEDGKMNRQINIRARVFDDGLAFRYEFPEQKNWSSYTLLDENTNFNLEGDPTFSALFLPNFTTSHEGRYSTLPFSKIVDDTLMDMPVLVKYPGNIYLAITEAALIDYAGMYLVKTGDILRSQLSPLPPQGEIKVKAKLPHLTPWRVLLISDNIGKLIESNILTSLNEPCKIKDISWIKPGKSDFHWWNGDISTDTSFVPGINFEFNKYYIDFCSENNIDFHSVIGYNNKAWYQNDGEGYAPPGPNADVTKPLLDMKKICDYGKEKNVGIRVWVHWAVLYPKLEEAFTLFEDWGLKGMMVDFMDRDDQEMVNIQNRILQSAAKHHLHIQFHGAYKPTGLNRTYPNEFTREGTLNYECNKWGNIITPDDDIIIPFTRGLAGSTDYHLGGFRAIPIPKFVAQDPPFVVGTRCHMLAMYVILQSSLQMVCDYPDAYKNQPGFEFIKEIPTVWDETKVVGAEEGEWLTIARRKNNDWYVGTITDHEKRNIKLSLNFLPEGKYTAEIYSDDLDSDNYPDHLIKKVVDIKNNDTISVDLIGGGGQVIRLVPFANK